MSSQPGPNHPRVALLEARLIVRLLRARLLVWHPRARLVAVQALLAESVPLLALIAAAVAAGAGRRWE
jgi:hypothetical protein